MLTKLRLALLAAALSACGTSIQETPINAAPRPMAARPPDSVEVFSSGQPTRPHVDVAYLEAEQSSGFSEDDTPQFVAKLRVAAAKRGCDAIVLGGITHDVNVYGRSSSNQKGIVATCVVYTQ
jgi:hypothetical protein|nr:hypothetical protein [Kofleriaceae bacterium]